MQTIDTLLSALMERVQADGMEVSITVRPVKAVKENTVNWKRIEELYPRDQFDWSWIDKETMKCREWCVSKSTTPTTLRIINWLEKSPPPKSTQMEAFTRQYT